MGPASTIFLCVLVRGMDEVSPKPSTGLDQNDRLLPPRTPEVILASFFSGLQNNQVNKLLPAKQSNQHVIIYSSALKKHILGRSDANKKSGDSLEGRSDPSSLFSTLLQGVISLTSSILRHKVAVLSILVAALAFSLVLVVGQSVHWISHRSFCCTFWEWVRNTLVLSGECGRSNPLHMPRIQIEIICVFRCMYCTLSIEHWPGNTRDFCVRR